MTSQLQFSVALTFNVFNPAVIWYRHIEYYVSNLERPHDLEFGQITLKK